MIDLVKVVVTVKKGGGGGGCFCRMVVKKQNIIQIQNLSKLLTAALGK